MKNCPATPVVHGTLHLGIGGRQPVRILCRRSVRCAPCVRLRFRTRLWSLAGGGAIGSLSGYSPARSLCPEESTSVNVPRRYNTWDKGARHTFALTPRSGLHLFSAHGALRPLVGLSPQVRPSALKTSPAKFGCNQETENTRGRTPIRGTGTSISVTWEAGISPG